MRVVSLVPSATEIVCLFDPDILVGRSHECDHPPSIAGSPGPSGSPSGGESEGDRPALTTPLVGPTSGNPERLDPAAIDRAVREAGDAPDVHSLYTLDASRLRELRPDLVITQSMCDVCSIDLDTVRGAAPEGATIVSLDPETIEDVLDDILRIGDLVGHAAAARRLVTSYRERMHRAQEVVVPYVDPIVVGFLEWTDPLFCAGHWTVQMIERAGGSHPWNPTEPIPGTGAAVGPQQASRRAGRSFEISMDDLCRHRPDRLVVCPCGIGLDEATRLAKAIPDLPDVPTAVVDGNAMFNRPGPRLVEAFEFLCAWLHDRPVDPDFPVRLLDRTPSED